MEQGPTCSDGTPAPLSEALVAVLAAHAAVTSGIVHREPFRRAHCTPNDYRDGKAHTMLGKEIEFDFYGYVDQARNSNQGISAAYHGRLSELGRWDA